MNDSRILLSRKALGMLEQQIRTRRFKISANEGNLNAEIKILKEIVFNAIYYPNAASALEYMKLNKYSQIAAALEKDIKFDVLRVKEEKKSLDSHLSIFCLRILTGLETRMLYSDALRMVDTVYGSVMSTSKHPGANNLQICNVDAGPLNDYYGERSLKIVTNDLAVKKGEMKAVALLPPKVLIDFVSHGMFFGPDKLPLPSAAVGERASLPLEFCVESLAAVEKFLKEP